MDTVCGGVDPEFMVVATLGLPLGNESQAADILGPARELLLSIVFPYYYQPCWWDMGHYALQSGLCHRTRRRIANNSDRSHGGVWPVSQSRRVLSVVAVCQPFSRLSSWNPQMRAKLHPLYSCTLGGGLVITDWAPLLQVMQKTFPGLLAFELAMLFAEADPVDDVPLKQLLARARQITDPFKGGQRRFSVVRHIDMNCGKFLVTSRFSSPSVVVHLVSLF